MYSINVKKEPIERERERQRQRQRQKERERERLLLNPSPEMRPHSPAYTAHESPLLA